MAGRKSIGDMVARVEGTEVCFDGNGAQSCHRHLAPVAGEARVLSRGTSVLHPCGQDPASLLPDGIWLHVA
jgi:hypothetical protein